LQGDERSKGECEDHERQCVDVAAKHHMDLPAVPVNAIGRRSFRQIVADTFCQQWTVANNHFWYTKFLNDRTPSDSSQVSISVVRRDNRNCHSCATKQYKDSKKRSAAASTSPGELTSLSLWCLSWRKNLYALYGAWLVVISIISS
jgi:hypothetical protein